MSFEMQMSFRTAARLRVKYSEMNEGDSNVSMQIKKKKKAQMSSYVTLTFLISQGEDSAGAVSTLHNEVVSDRAYAAVTQHCPLDAVLCRHL